MLRYIDALKAWRASFLGLFDTGHMTRWDYQRRLELQLDVFESYVSGDRWASCAICRQAFRYPSKGHQARYCQWPFCRWIGAQRLRATHRRGVQHATCIGCEKPFPSRRNTARYCRASCRQRAYRQRVTLKQKGQSETVVLASQTAQGVTLISSTDFDTLILA